MRHAMPAVICWLVLAGCHGPAAEDFDNSAASGSLFDGRTLGRWKQADYLFTGDVYVKDGRIVLEQGDELTGITWTGPVLRTDYEISLEAMRVEGEDFFCGLTFPVGEDYCSLIVGGWHGKVVGLSNVDLMDAWENSTTILLDFEKGRGMTLRSRPADNGTIDGDQARVRISPRIITIRGAMEPCCPLGIASWKTTAAVRNITMRPLPAVGS